MSQTLRGVCLRFKRRRKSWKEILLEWVVKSSPPWARKYLDMLTNVMV